MSVPPAVVPVEVSPPAARRAWGPAALVAVSTLRAAATDPLHRPIAWLAGLLAVGAAGFGLVLAPLGGRAAPWLWGLLGGAAGVVVMVLLVALASVTVEVRGFHRAVRVWWLHDSRGRAVARARMLPDGAWRLNSVCAQPPGRGLGREVMTAVMTDAVDAGATLVLAPSTDRVGRWYEGLGFTRGEAGLILTNSRKGD
ncbi:hypothetical protein [Microlunatus sp. Y2014]|uniref:hypothetical protein n=1 Tax=Microlunatus sp. Y2014 TaxID=3418488 RepID=UPI003DA6EC14